MKIAYIFNGMEFQPLKTAVGTLPARGLKFCIASDFQDFLVISHKKGGAMWQLVERDETKIDDWKKLLISLRKLGCWFFDCDACSTLITAKDGVELVSRFNRMSGEPYLFKVVENICADVGIALGDHFQKEGMVVSVEGLYEDARTRFYRRPILRSR
jgi:hypothetical protein